MKKLIVSLVMLLAFAMHPATKYEIISKTLSFEGTKLEGTSKRGIEQATLNTYNKKFGTKWKLSTLTHDQAVDVLDKLYWNDRLNYINDDKVKQFIFDWSMNSNPAVAYKLIHKLFGLKPQSTLSLDLVVAINNTNHNVALMKLYNSRLSYLKSLKSWKKYGRGWKVRLDKLIEK